MICCLENETAHQSQLLVSSFILAYGRCDDVRTLLPELNSCEEVINPVMVFHDAQLCDNVVKVSGAKDSPK